MPEICCPYCNSRNVLKTVYAYRGVNKKHNKSINYNDYLKNGTILMQKKIKKKYDFDGEEIKYGKLYNRFCEDCKKCFCSMKNLAVVDIKRVNLIIGNNVDRKRYIFDFFDNQNSTYCYKKII